MLNRAVTWWTILRICLEERLVYRGDFALGTLMRFLPIVTQIFLWWAVFESIGDQSGQQTISGYGYTDFVAYYLLTMLSRAFSSMPGLASGIALQVRNGEVKKFLIQPVDLLGFLLLNRLAHKLAYYSVAIGPFALVFFLCRDYFPGWPPVDAMIAFLLSLVLGFLMGYFLEAAIGLISFWFLEVSSLLFVYMLLSFFLSGHMFPLDILQEVSLFGGWTCYDLVRATPLNYLAYFPAAVFLQKVTGPELIRGLWIGAGWLALFIVLSRWMWSRGVRRYSGFGG